MGGYGSGRWGWHRAKTLVEHCSPLHVSTLRDALAHNGPGWRGSVHWTQGGEPAGSIGYTMTAEGGRRILRLDYSHDGKPMAYDVLMQSVPLHFGGRRWYFTCPLITNGKPCRRRVGVLYLAPGCAWFGCRHCLNLAYYSTRHSHDLDRWAYPFAAERGIPLRVARQAFRDVFRTPAMRGRRATNR